MPKVIFIAVHTMTPFDGKPGSSGKMDIFGGIGRTDAVRHRGGW
jgi:hypothetical protein